MSTATHRDNAPGAAYALRLTADRRPLHPSGRLTPLSRAVILAAGALADRDLHGPNGYSGHTADEVAEVTGHAPALVHRAMVGAARVGDLTREQATDRFRIPETAFNPED